MITDLFTFPDHFQLGEPSAAASTHGAPVLTPAGGTHLAEVMSAGGGDGVGEQVEADGAGELLLCEQLRRLCHRAAPGGGHRGGGV